MSFAASPLRFLDRPARPLGLFDWFGLFGGLLLPLLAATVYKTYGLTVGREWLEITRQAGMIFIAAEIAIIMHARRRGMNPVAIIRTLPRWAGAALIVFLMTFWISSVGESRLVGFSLMLSLGWIVQLLFAASLYHYTSHTSAIDMPAVARGFVLGLIGLTASIVLHFTTIPAALIGPHGAVDWGSSIPGFISNRLFGSWCGAVLALLTGIAWQQHDDRERGPLYLMLAFAFGLTLWTATRAALLGWVIGVPIAWLLAGPPASRAIYTRLPLYLLAAGCVALVMPPYGNSAFTLLRIGGTESLDAVSSGRLALWENALRVAADYPLLGSGAGSNWWLVPVNGFYHVQPHNAVVQFLLNWGLIPTIPALMLLVGATWHAHRNLRHRPEILPAILMLDCLLTMSMFDGMLHFAQFIMLVVGCLAICLAQKPAPGFIA